MPAKDLLFLRKLLAPSLLLVMALGLHLFWTEAVRLAGWPPRLEDWGRHATAVFLAGALALLIRLLLHGLATRHLDGAVPLLMRQTISALVWIVTLGILLAIVFQVPLGSLVTTSGMLVAVLGIALKNLISDLFTGLLLPVKLGDWIEVDGQPAGQVVEVSWRATHIVTRNRQTVVIPNTHLVQKPFRNYSLPDPVYQEYLRVTLPLSVTGEQAERLLLSAAGQVEAVTRHPLKKPNLRICGFPHGGVEWELNFYVPDPAVAHELRYQVYRHLVHNLRLAGIALPSDAPAIFLDENPAAPPGHDLAFLGLLDLFSGLTDDERTQLAERLKPHRVPAHRAVVRQGEDGDSLFVVKEGLFDVFITGPDDLPTLVGQLGAGQFFGEMSLLTGAARSATVRARLDSLLYEITRDDLLPLLRRRPALAQQISDVLAARQLGNAPKLQDGRRETAETVESRSLSQQFLKRISAFFRLQEAVS